MDEKKVAKGLLAAVVASNHCFGSDVVVNAMVNTYNTTGITLETSKNTDVITEDQSGVEAVQETQAEEIVEAQVSVLNTTTNEFDVGNFEDLQKALNKEGSVVNITQNIVFEDQQLFVNAKNVTINGNGYTFNLNETNTKNKFMVRGSGLTINDLTIEGYASSGMYIYGGKDITLTSVNLNGKDDKSSLVGIDADSASITIENVSTKNHKYSGIRVRKNSTIISNGGTSHTNDYKQIECLEDGGTNTVINNNNDTIQYTVVSTSVVNGVRKVYYALAHSVKVTNYQELKDAIANANSIINIESDITLESDLTIREEKVVINGNDYTINCNGDYKLTISSANASIDRLNFENYLTGGLSVYNATNAKLTDIRLFGNDKEVSYDVRSKTGLDISNSTVEIAGIQTENHLWRGIQVRNGSTVTVTSQNTHYGDTGHLQVIHGGVNSGAISTIVDKNQYYIIKAPYIDEYEDTIINYYNPSFYNKPVFNGVDDKEIQLGESFDSLDGVSVTDIEDVTIDKSKIKVKGTVETDKVGEYKLTYEVEDYDGNKTVVERTIYVADIPTTLPDDVPADTNKPNDSDNVGDDNMGVDPDKDQVVDDTPTTLPDDIPVDTNKPNDSDNVGDDNMGVDPDKDQVVDDKPTTLPDDVPVEEDKSSTDVNGNGTGSGSGTVSIPGTGTGSGIGTSSGIGSGSSTGTETGLESGSVSGNGTVAGTGTGTNSGNASESVAGTGTITGIALGNGSVSGTASSNGTELSKGTASGNETSSGKETDSANGNSISAIEKDSSDSKTFEIVKNPFLWLLLLLLLLLLLIKRRKKKEERRKKKEEGHE